MTTRPCGQWKKKIHWNVQGCSPGGTALRFFFFVSLLTRTQFVINWLQTTLVWRLFHSMNCLNNAMMYYDEHCSIKRFLSFQQCAGWNNQLMSVIIHKFFFFFSKKKNEQKWFWQWHYDADLERAATEPVTIMMSILNGQLAETGLTRLLRGNPVRHLQMWEFLATPGKLPAGFQADWTARLSRLGIFTKVGYCTCQASSTGLCSFHSVGAANFVPFHCVGVVIWFSIDLNIHNEWMNQHIQRRQSQGVVRITLKRGATARASRQRRHLAPVLSPTEWSLSMSWPIGTPSCVEFHDDIFMS